MDVGECKYTFSEYMSCPVYRIAAFDVAGANWSKGYQPTLPTKLHTVDLQIG
jgi:hypothetical protein